MYEADQLIPASDPAVVQPKPDMTELPTPNPGERLATKAELDQVTNAVLALTSKIDNANSDLGQFDSFMRDFGEFVEFNNLKFPPVSGEKTKFAGSR